MQSFNELIQIVPPYIALFVPFIVYYKTKTDKQRTDSAITKSDLALQEIKEHKAECAEINKEVLLEKINNLSQRFDSFENASREFRAEMNRKIDGLITHSTHRRL